MRPGFGVLIGSLINIIAALTPFYFSFFIIIGAFIGVLITRDRSMLLGSVVGAVIGIFSAIGYIVLSLAPRVIPYIPFEYGYAGALYSLTSIIYSAILGLAGGFLAAVALRFF